MNRKNYLLAFILCMQTLFASAQVYPVRAKLTDKNYFTNDSVARSTELYKVRCQSTSF